MKTFLRPLTLFGGIYLVSGIAISFATGSIIEGFATAFITSILKSIYAHCHHLVWEKIKCRDSHKHIPQCKKCNVSLT